jgi:hypothetical protein
VGYLGTLRLGRSPRRISSSNLVAILVFAVLISVVAQAQVFPGGSSQHHLWDAANKLLFASHGVLEAVDFGITHRNLSDGGREMDSMAKALCESGTAGQLVFFGGRMAEWLASAISCTELGTTNWSGLFRFTPAGILRMGWVTASLTVRVGGWAETN